jgi:peptide/nickel transport system ATP-binding protein
MYLGEIIELADTDELFKEPLHPYTKALIQAVPIPDPKAKTMKIVLPGEVPSPINPPSGCRFHPRCPQAKPVCKEEKSELLDINPKHKVACHL